MASLILAVPYMEHCECEYEEPTPVEQCNEDYGDQCRTCLQTECCEGLTACEYDENCSCVLDCMGGDEADVNQCVAYSCHIYSYEKMNEALTPLNDACEDKEESKRSCEEHRYCTYPEPKPA